MDKSMIICSIIQFIEANIKKDLTYADLEKAFGLSYRSLREIFEKHTKTSLKKYINRRKIENAAFEIKTTDTDLTSISLSYGYEAYDTFTRAFKRITSLTPSEFRKSSLAVSGRKLLAVGTYAPGIVGSESLPEISGEPPLEHVLFGIPKIEYSSGKCVPFSSCLERTLSYINFPNIEGNLYALLSALSGASFRIRWNKDSYDMESTDLRNIVPDDPYLPFRRTFTALGLEYEILEKANSDKESFKAKISESVDRGFPLIALGIVGPPEACIIAGISGENDKILGLSYFQDNIEFNKDIEIYSNGYFATTGWWDNPFTTCIFILKNWKYEGIDLKEILKYISQILSQEQAGKYLCGQKAFEGWAKSLKNDEFFAKDHVHPLFMESILCQADAETVLAEGRYWASIFLEDVAHRNESLKALCDQASKYFGEMSLLGREMTNLRNGHVSDEHMVESFRDPEIRKNLAKMICAAKELELKGKACINEMIDLI